MCIRDRCKNCHYSEDKLLAPYELPKFEQSLLNTQCKKCSNITLAISETKDLIDEFIEQAEKAGVNVEIISTETEEGVMLKESFHGIAAILRYRRN